MATKTNAEIAAAFDELGDLYELDGAVSYRVVAYRTAAKAEQIRKIRGLGKRVEENLLRVLAEQEEGGGGPAPRILLSRAIPVAEQIAGVLRDHPAADRVEIAGSVRRMADTAKDIDIIATASDVKALISTLAELPLVESLAASGDAGARVVTHSGMKVDLRVVAPEQFGNVLQHFTGAKAH